MSDKEARAWRMGVWAFKTGDNCPFNVDSEEGKAWKRGFETMRRTHCNAWG